MKTLTCCFVIACLMMSQRVYGQNTAVDIGQKCPDGILSMFHYKSQTAKLSDFKNKLIILDFWATWCGGCIQALGKFDSLQNVFKDQLSIIPVSEQDRKVIEKFWLNNRITRNVSLPSVIGDTILKTWFPHTGVPHEVWINKDGTVIGITSSEYTTEENIRAVLQGGKKRFSIKTDITYDLSKPLFRLDDSFQSGTSSIFHSGLSAYLKGSQMTTELVLDTVGASVRGYIINNSIIDLYKRTIKGLAYEQQRNRFVLETSDSLRFYFDRKTYGYLDDWIGQNTFCYEIMVPLGTGKSDILTAMRFDLNRYFNLNGRAERRRVKCWVIRDLNDKKYMSKTDTSGYSLDNLVVQLNNKKGLPFVINESSFKGTIALSPDIERIINNKQSGLYRINNALNKYGVVFFGDERVLEEFILTDNRK